MAMRFARLFLLCLVMAMASTAPTLTYAQSNTGSAPEWVQGDIVELRTLDKITARTGTIEAVVGQPTRFGSLQITVHACTYRPPVRAPENAAFLEVRVVDHTGAVSDTPIFNGWMFASSPGVNALEHSVYDVSVLACKKA